ncbi:MAG: hypothetical protein WA977_08595 [Halobacteriota archaeon]
MVVVRAGKFTMCIVAFAMSGEDSVFQGITGVEGSLQEFRDLNALLEKYPVYPFFDLSDMMPGGEKYAD